MPDPQTCTLHQWNSWCVQVGLDTSALDEMVADVSRGVPYVCAGQNILLHALLSGQAPLTRAHLTLLANDLVSYPYPDRALNDLLQHPLADIDLVCHIAGRVMSSDGGAPSGGWRGAYEQRRAGREIDFAHLLTTYPHPAVSLIAQLRGAGSHHWYPGGHDALLKLNSLRESSRAHQLFTEGMRALAAFGERGFTTAAVLYHQNYISGPGLVAQITALYEPAGEPYVLLSTTAPSALSNGAEPR